jgi:activator of HSP90 ATPase
VETIKQAIIIPCKPKDMYEAWLSTTEHQLFTGSKAFINPVVGGSYYTYDGYFSGETISLDPYHKIGQTLIIKDDEWPPKHKSTITLEILENIDSITLKFEHSNIPQIFKEDLETYWLDNYWQPLQSYFIRKKMS